MRHSKPIIAADFRRWGAPAGGMGSRLLRTVSSSFPAGTAVIVSPSAAQRQRTCRGSLDVLRSASSRVSKLVASTRNVALKVSIGWHIMPIDLGLVRSCDVLADFIVQKLHEGGSEKLLMYLQSDRPASVARALPLHLETAFVWKPS